MAKLVLKMNTTLDGFVCGPGGEMDWFLKTRSEDGAAWTVDKIAQADAHLLGRRTFNEMVGFWPGATGAFAKPMNEIPKIAFSKTGFDPAPSKSKAWAEAKVISGDLTTGIKALKEESNKLFVALGGASFAQSLMQTGLVDELWYLTHPVAIGGGLAMFPQMKAPIYFDLVESQTFSAGTTARVYRAVR